MRLTFCVESKVFRHEDFGWQVVARHALVYDFIVLNDQVPRPAPVSPRSSINITCSQSAL